MKKILLFCIPFSGGSGAAYIKWKETLGNEIMLSPIELAGRGTRIKEPLYDSLTEAVKDIAANIISKLDEKTDYAIWGHSMGSLLAFETYYELKRQGVKLPMHMFFSGRKAPQDEGSKTAFYRLPEEAFLQVVYKYGGNTRELMKHEELRGLFLPIFRADFKIAETYEYIPKDSKIDCDITIVNGTDDDSIKMSDLTLWSEHAGKKIDFVSIEGGHFFITDNSAVTTGIINKALLGYLNEI